MTDTIIGYELNEVVNSEIALLLEPTTQEQAQAIETLCNLFGIAFSYPELTAIAD